MTTILLATVKSHINSVPVTWRGVATCAMTVFVAAVALAYAAVLVMLA